MILPILAALAILGPYNIEFSADLLGAIGLTLLGVGF
jgi:hypothetical protein